MSLETFGFISDLVSTNPQGSDPRSQGDDHLRGVKATLQATFPDADGAIKIGPDHVQVGVHVQVGDSATAARNFTLSVPIPPDGTMKLARGNAGATTQDIMLVDAAGVVTFPENPPPPTPSFLESAEVFPNAAIATISNVSKDITSLVLPAGTWDVTAYGGCGVMNALSQFYMGLSLVSNTLVLSLAGNGKLYTVRHTTVGQLLGVWGGVIPGMRVVAAVPTTVYLVANGFGGAGSGYGKIEAREVA